MISRAGNDPVLRYQLLPPDIVDRDEFVGFWKSNVHPTTRRAAENKAKRRLQFDVDLEFGLQSRTGRTLELTGSVAAEVYLGAPHRAAIIGRRAVDNAAVQFSADRSRRPRAGTLGAWHGRTGTDPGGHSPRVAAPLHREERQPLPHLGRPPRGQGMPAFPKGARRRRFRQRPARSLEGFLLTRSPQGILVRPLDIAVLRYHPVRRRLPRQGVVRR